MLQRLNAADRRWLAVWFLITLLVRGVTIASMAGMLERDTDGYRQLAENVRRDGVFGFRDANDIRPSAFRPPLYPLLLTATVRDGAVSLPWVAVVHVALGALTVICVWMTAALALQLRWGAHVAAAAVAVDPILLMQSPQLMTETLAAALAAAALLSWVVASDTDRRAAWLVVGASLGLACLCRPTFLATTALLIALLLWFAWRQRSALTPAILVAVSAAVPVACWTARNTAVMGQPIVATTHGGYTLLLGNNPRFYEHLRDRKELVWTAASLDRDLNQLRVANDWDEGQFDQYAAREARAAIASDPTGFLRAAAYRLSRLFGVLPTRTNPEEGPRRAVARYAVAVWYVLVLGLAAFAGAKVLRAATANTQVTAHPNSQASGYTSQQAELTARRMWCAMLAFVVSFALLHLFYWCDMRMRAPLSPLFAIAAAFALENGAKSIFTK